jgi:hypothetical protein
MSVDPQRAYERLQRETAQMLGFGAEPSSGLKGLTVDAISLLRLEISDLAGAAVSGASVDLDRLTTALALLSRLLPEAALQAQPQLVEEELTEREASAAMLELESLLGKYVEAKHRAWAEDPDAAREEFEAELAAAIERYPPAPKPIALPAPPVESKTEAPNGATKIFDGPPDQTNSRTGQNGHLAKINAGPATEFAVPTQSPMVAPAAAKTNGQRQPSSTELFYQNFGMGYDRWRPDW